MDESQSQRNECNWRFQFTIVQTAECTIYGVSTLLKPSKIDRQEVVEQAKAMEKKHGAWQRSKDCKGSPSREMGMM